MPRVYLANVTIVLPSLSPFLLEIACLRRIMSQSMPTEEQQSRALRLAELKASASASSAFSNKAVFGAFAAINDASSRDLDPGRFVTFVSLHSSGDLEVLSASHAALFCYFAAEDRFSEVDSQGVPLGILPEFMSAPSTILNLNRGISFLW